jgi:hypothetical protein
MRAMNAAALKRRLAVMIGVDLVCLLVASAAIVGYVAGHVAILGPVFVAAIAAGVAAQIWFIVGFARTDPAPIASGKA